MADCTCPAAALLWTGHDPGCPTKIKVEAVMSTKAKSNLDALVKALNAGSYNAPPAPGGLTQGSGTYAPPPALPPPPVHGSTTTLTHHHPDFVYIGSSAGPSYDPSKGELSHVHAIHKDVWNLISDFVDKQKHDQKILTLGPGSQASIDYVRESMRHPYGLIPSTLWQFDFEIPAFLGEKMDCIRTVYAWSGNTAYHPQKQKVWSSKEVQTYMAMRSLVLQALQTGQKITYTS